MLLFLFLTILVSGKQATDFSYDSNFTEPVERFRPGNDMFPLAEGTRSDCILYYWLEDITDNYSAHCWSLASSVGASSEELILWNPSLAEPNGSSEVFEDLTAIPTTLNRGFETFRNAFTYPCTIAPSKSYCIALSTATASAGVADEEQPPTPRAAGEISGCTMWLDVPKAITCNDLMIMNNLEFGEFFKMNPSVGEDCSGLVVGTNYCRSTYPGGKDFGIPGWSSSRPSGRSSTAASTQQASGVTASEIGMTTTRPSPVQTGVSQFCIRFHKVEKGDTCYDIANNSKITLSTFYKWNPAVKSDCSALELGTYVCTAVS